jgi:hypothetical protein
LDANDKLGETQIQSVFQHPSTPTGWSMTNNKFYPPEDTLSAENCLKGKSIDFSIDPSGLYFVSRYVRPLDDKSLVSDYELFFDSDMWTKGLYEFTDLRNPKILNISEQGLINLGHFVEKLFADRGIEEYYTAIYAPNPLPFGLARMYQAFTEDNAEVSQIFRDYTLAKDWLANKCRASSD